MRLVAILVMSALAVPAAILPTLADAPADANPLPVQATESADASTLQHVWAGAPATFVCVDWTCVGAMGAPEHKVNVPSGFDRAELTVEWGVPYELSLTVSGTSVPDASYTATSSFSESWDLDGSESTFRLHVADPSIKQGGGTGVDKPIPFVATLRLS